MTETSLTALGIPAGHHDFFSRPLVATLTTVGADGLLQSTAIWYLFDEGEIRMSVRKDRQKYINLARDPRATLFIIDPDNATRTLEIRGRVELRDDPGASKAERFAPMYGKPPSTWDPEGSQRALIIIRPERVVTLG